MSRRWLESAARGWPCSSGGWGGGPCSRQTTPACRARWRWRVGQREPPRGLVWLLGTLVAIGALLSRRPVSRLPAGVDAEDLEAGYERSDMRPGVVLLGA